MQTRNTAIGFKRGLKLAQGREGKKNSKKMRGDKRREAVAVAPWWSPAV